MKNWKLSPNNKLIADYIDCYWFLEKEPGDTGSNHPKLNPDPSAHLILSDPSLPHTYASGSRLYRLSGCHWIFPHRHTYDMNHTTPFKIIGIKFRVGALYSMPSKTHELELDSVQQVDNNDVPDVPLDQLLTLLCDAADNPHTTRDRLDDLLMVWIATFRADRHSELTHAVLALLDSNPLATLGAALHRSQRTLERSFFRTTGLTLKQCQSMNRFEAMLMHIYQLDRDDINWSDIACEYGFSDQPHLIRYVKATLGQTPGGYAKARNLTIDVYGDFELD